MEAMTNRFDWDIVYFAVFLEGLEENHRRDRETQTGSTGCEMDDYVKIAVLENEIEAQLLESVLNERQIPHRMRSYYDTAYDGLFQTQRGWGNVQAPDTFREEIMEIITDIRGGADNKGSHAT